MTFREKLLKLRKERGLSQEELASQISVSRQAVSRWEMGRSMPDVENLLQLCRAFGVRADDLLSDGCESDTEIQAPGNTGKNRRMSRKKIVLVTLAAMALLSAGLWLWLLGETFTAQRIGAGLSGGGIGIGLGLLFRIFVLPRHMYYICPLLGRL